MWEALQHAGWATTLATTRWLYALVSVVHYLTIFFVVGTILLMDLRILGVAARNQPLSSFVQQLQPWTWIGLSLSLVSGFLLFTTEAGDFAAATPFRVKMLIILLAVAFSLAVEWNVPGWHRSAVIPMTAKLLAVISIVLWLGAVLVGVEIAALTGLG
jgi:hypothetical protein